MIKITVVRHGETDWNKEGLIQGTINTPLNDNGRNQAIECGKKFKYEGYDFTHCYTSTLDRAYETASLILQNMENPSSIVKHEGFIERDFGDFQGKKVENSFFEVIYSDGEGNYERTATLRDRLEKSLKEICIADKDSHILIVCHSHSMKGIMSLVEKDFDWNKKVANLENYDFSYVDNSFIR